MKKQAKLLALILAFCLSTAGLTACDSSTTTSDGAEISAQTEASVSGAEAAATSGEAENFPLQTLDVFDPAPGARATRAQRSRSFTTMCRISPRMI